MLSVAASSMLVRETLSESSGRRIARFIALSIALHMAVLAMVVVAPGYAPKMPAAPLRVVLPQPASTQAAPIEEQTPPTRNARPSTSTERPSAATTPAARDIAAAVGPTLVTPGQATPLAATRNDAAAAQPLPVARETAPSAATPAAAATPPPASPTYSAPYLKSSPQTYPRAARQNREEGTVLLRILVTMDGVPSTVELAKSSGSATLDRAAQQLVKSWLFEPARRGNDRIEDWVTIPVVYRLNEAS